MTEMQRMWLRQAVVALVLVAIVALVGWWTHPGPPRCEEDMPCWNCHTMGNHVCGPSHE